MSHHQEHHHEHECCGLCHDGHHQHHHGECSSHESCCGGIHGDKEHNFAHELIQLADIAWMELLKEKIKANIAKSSGSHLDELAKVVAETNHIRWQNKMAKQKNIDNFGEKLHSIFNSSPRKK